MDIYSWIIQLKSILSIFLCLPPQQKIKCKINAKLMQKAYSNRGRHNSNWSNLWNNKQIIIYIYIYIGICMHYITDVATNKTQIH